MTTRRHRGAFGELVLREAADGHHEVISNGTFLMDTRDGRSERGLVERGLAAVVEHGLAAVSEHGLAAVSEHGLAAVSEHGLAAVSEHGLHVVVGGLGVGFTLGAALASPLVSRVTVVEVEQAVVDLVRDVTGPRTGADLDDPRVAVVVGDLHDVLEGGGLPPAHLLCLDVDNGPAWTVAETNARLYEDEGLALLASALAPGGAVAVWSAHDDPGFAARLQAVFGRVARHTWAVERGEPDVVWVAGPAPAARVSAR